jgi:dTMP kinase
MDLPPVRARRHGLPGVFVALEGGEAAGKSTQVAALADALRRLGVDLVVTREPGDCSIGPAVRSVLLDHGNAGLDPRAEALLYAADRAAHAAEVIRPALQRGALVLSDRYVDSSIAYQGVARGLGADHVAAVSAWATDGLLPDLTIVLDLDPTRAAQRQGALDRLEAEPRAFHEQVRAAFLALAAADPGGHVVVDADRPASQITADLLDAVARVLPATPRSAGATA